MAHNATGYLSLRKQLGVTKDEITNDVMALPYDIRLVLLHRSGLLGEQSRALTVAETAKVLGIHCKTVVTRFRTGIELLKPKYLHRPRSAVGRAHQALGLA